MVLAVEAETGSLFQNAQAIFHIRVFLEAEVSG